ncbi:MAG: hydroxymethylpyrimidine/phosphomethylpyrimidine kinase [Gammaproteobacteria bacterium]
MNTFNPQKPVVLVFAGHDPSGGAGIQADIESIASTGCHAATVITTITRQNTQSLEGHTPQNIDDFNQQARLILQDMDIKAIKIGVIGDKQLLYAISELLEECRNIPVVLDPIIQSGTGYKFLNDDLCKDLIKKILPLTTIVTPNSLEARTLTDPDYTLDAAAKKFLEYGCENILITGAHEKTEQIINTLYSKNEPDLNFKCERLPGEYHGSGCTLSSSIAAHLALGCNVKDAIAKALHYTWESLSHGNRHGSGQLLPDRIAWRLKDD